MVKNLLCPALLLFAFLFASISGVSASEIVLDAEHHHPGDDFKEELTPHDPEGLVYMTTFNLDPLADIRYAEFTVTVKSVVPEPRDEFLDKVYLNEIKIGNLNAYIPENTSDSAAVDILIPFHPTFFNPGNNTIKIIAGNDSDGSNYDDFEFYNLTLHLSEIEPVTLDPPLKVAWTYELPWKLRSGMQSWVNLVADGVLYLSEGAFGENGIIAMDAETGEPLWSKEWSADLGYKDGVLFAVHYPNIDALDAKTGELLWSKKYRDVGWSTPIIFGNTLFVSTPYDRYVAAIDTENGALRWDYEFNRTDFETEGRSDYYLGDPVVNGNVVVFGYHALHTIYTDPITRESGEPEPELEEPVVMKGLIALDTKTGKEVWEYTQSEEYSPFYPFLCKDLVCIYVGEGDIIALSLESGEEVWKTNVGSWANIVELKHDKIFVNSDRPVILDAKSGEILKEYPDSTVSFSSSMITDKFVYSTDLNKIQVFDSTTGETVWSSSRIKGYEVSHPALYKDKLYLISSEGTLYAFEHGEEGIFFTKGLENSATFYFPPIAIAAMLILLAVLLRKSNNKALVSGSWLLALVGVLLLSLRAVDPYFRGGEVFGIPAHLVFGFLLVIFLFGIAFLVSGIRKSGK
ncbi:PQQ-like beta-propeller repeat protein [Methanosarcina sp. KYL-1]|uniref:PQQ-like beta-propeller repeat protein n=1 Tax=Methanosarcina sp. KYL-1 TaxID=2602068 RepID=UPI002101896F|nr:PQQ-like beta-propeller repeat protein [Methanosarcina sp. KYL-1]